MDANGARFWMWAGPPDLGSDDARARWDQTRASWLLSSERAAPELSEDATVAAARREAVPHAIDNLGAVARAESDGTEHVVIASHAGLTDREIFRGADPITSIAIGTDAIVTVLAGGKVQLRAAGTFGDTQEDWHTFESAELDAWRVACGPGGGAWILDRSHRSLARWRGTLLRHRPSETYAPGTFRPSPEDPETIFLSVGPSNAFDGDSPIGIACSSEGRVAVACVRSDADARVHIFDRDGTSLGRASLAAVREPYSIAWVGADRVALLLTSSDEALVYLVDLDDPEWLPAGDRYPLRDHDGSAFLQTADSRARYRSHTAPRLLVALSLPSRASQGVLRSSAFDGERADVCWHRLYIEAALPEGCGVRVELAATASGAPPADDAYCAHDFGIVPGSAPPIPQGAWVPFASEIPSSQGLLRCGIEFQRAGLFTALIQRQGKMSTRVVGRYLHARVTLFGTGRTTPELAAIRAWGSRFSYVREYLPAIYHEDPSVDATSLDGSASGADFFDRFVSIFEGVLTPLEDRVANAWQLTNPRLAPPEAIEWLASWVGRTLDPSFPERVQRAMVQAVPQLAALRGTRRGLELALEIVSEGGITRGEIVVLEEFRLRRTFATILGADLADEQDPLLGGLAVSGNSIVGDTLFLGDEHHREFMALFGPRTVDLDRATNAADRAQRLTDQQAIDRLFEDTANRASVLVASDVGTEVLGRVRAIIEAESPAHVGVQVRVASRRFVVGLSALVGVDTHLAQKPTPPSVRLGTTVIGAGARLSRTPSMHPDLEGEGS